MNTPDTYNKITIEELKLISDTTVRLLEIRQRGCPRLCLENIAPELMHKLLTRLRMHKDGLMCVTGFEPFDELNTEVRHDD